jgi:hypothetical protein
MKFKLYVLCLIALGAVAFSSCAKSSGGDDDDGTVKGYSSDSYYQNLNYDMTEGYDAYSFE